MLGYYPENAPECLALADHRLGDSSLLCAKRIAYAPKIDAGALVFEDGSVRWTDPSCVEIWSSGDCASDELIAIARSLIAISSPQRDRGAQELMSFAFRLQRVCKSVEQNK